MTWTRRWFDVSWRLTVLLLPWQTRWFQEGPLLGGYPWEGGRWSIYVSWLPLALTVLLGCLRGSKTHVAPGDRRSEGRHEYWSYILAAALFSIFASTYRPATMQWWIEVGLLIAFARTLIHEVDHHDLIRWIIYAIIPHAVLGFTQYATQFVTGSKWLGIATQDPLTRGVSVVDVGKTRWLRAYGGFPHPNILGGWIILGLSSLFACKSRLVYPIAALFGSALVLSFSRSAWLAAVILLLATSHAMLRSSDKENRSRLLVLVCTILCAITLTAAFCAPLIQTRATTAAPLESKSLSEREQGYKGGIELFKRYPWLGVGPRVASMALARESIAQPLTIPVPPHNVFLLILCEIGIIGSSILVIALFFLVKKHPSLFSILDTRYPTLLSLLPILFLDHYLWSTWSGLALAALVLAVYLSQNQGLSRPAQTA